MAKPAITAMVGFGFHISRSDYRSWVAIVRGSYRRASEASAVMPIAFARPGDSARRLSAAESDVQDAG
jgi:hypothetical protein